MRVNLDVEIEFGEHTSGMTAGMVRFSLKRAELHFDLTGCQLPVRDRQVVSPFAQKVKGKRHISQSRESKAKEEAKADIDFKLSQDAAKITGQHADKQTSQQETTTKTEDEFSFTHFNISSAGGPDHPYWRFAPTPGNEALIGSNPNTDWGTITITGSPATIDAFIRTAPDDILIKGVGGVWPEEMPPRKHRILRFVALQQLNFKDYLSKIRFVSVGGPFNG
jgi:hypothetical protein